MSPYFTCKKTPASLVLGAPVNLASLVSSTFLVSTRTPDLVDFISSGPIVALVLQGKNAISKNRELMGATDPKKAEKNTIRADLASSIDQNAVHGSDSVETAKEEINFFFTPEEVFS